MRSIIPVVLLLACPVGMCLIPMLLMRRRGQVGNCHSPAGAREANPSPVEMAVPESEEVRDHARAEGSSDAQQG